MCAVVEVIVVNEGGKTGKSVGSTESVNKGEERTKLPASAGVKCCEPFCLDCILGADVCRCARTALRERCKIDDLCHCLTDTTLGFLEISLAVYR